jgi:hypothetical protein
MKKRAKKTQKCLPENHSGDPRLDRWIGVEFDWCEPWEWEEDTMPHDLLDSEGNPPDELCGLWRVDSVNEDGETAWVRFVPTDGDQQMEFPLSLIPDPEVGG